MPRMFIEESIRPGTSQCMINHILFTDHHHYSHLSQEAVIAKYKGTVLGEFLDFEKMEKLKKDFEVAREEENKRQEILRNSPVTMDHVMRGLCGDELMKTMRNMFK